MPVLKASETWKAMSFRYSSRQRGIPPGGSDSGSSQVASLKMFENHRVRDRDGRDLILNEAWASSSVRIEHQPPKLGVEGSNPSPLATDKPRPF